MRNKGGLRISGGSDIYLKELNKPLSFIGVAGSRAAFLDGEWVELEDVMTGKWENGSALHELRNRLRMIKVKLLEGNLVPSEMEALYLEGQGIRRAIHIMTRRHSDDDDEPIRDMRRWIEYGRKIS